MNSSVLRSIAFAVLGTTLVLCASACKSETTLGPTEVRIPIRDAQLVEVYALKVGEEEVGRLTAYERPDAEGASPRTYLVYATENPDRVVGHISGGRAWRLAVQPGGTDEDVAGPIGLAGQSAAILRLPIRDLVVQEILGPRDDQ